MAERYYRGILAHWRDQEAIYFVSWRLGQAQPDLNPSERELIMSVLKHFEGQRYQLTALVVMNDQVDVLLSTREP